MTRSDIVAALAKRFPQLDTHDADLSAKVILDALSRSIASGDKIELRGFGSFGVNYRPPRLGRNPKTGASVKVSSKYVPRFKAGRELRERVGASSPTCHIHHGS